MPRTRVGIDEKLLAEAMKLTRKKSEKDTLNLALGELIRKIKRQKMLELEGKVQWEGDLGEMRKGRG